MSGPATYQGQRSVRQILMLSCDSRISALPQIPKCRYKGVNFLAGVIKRQRGAECALHAKIAQDWLCAVMATAHCNPLAVQVIADFLGAEAIHHEGQNAGFFLCRPDGLAPKLADRNLFV
jgi:hypothetical protein